MKICFTEAAWEDYQYWVQLQELKTPRKKLKRIGELVKNIQQSPLEESGKPGLGKPEPLRFNLTGCWSRRIDSEHRLVYQINPDGGLILLQCRYHY